MKASELRTKTQEELQEQLLELLREQFNLRMQKGSGQLTRHAQMRAVRRDISRIKTIMTEQHADN